MLRLNSSRAQSVDSTYSCQSGTGPLLGSAAGSNNSELTKRLLAEKNESGNASNLTDTLEAGLLANSNNVSRCWAGLAVGGANCSVHAFVRTRDLGNGRSRNVIEVLFKPIGG
jgi:hypothetical protein